MMVTLDGYFEGKDHDISWHNVDEEFNDFAIKQTNSVSTLIFGRRTYELMASYWPTEGAKNDDPEVANLMNTLPKIVVSSTLEKAEWENTKVIKENVKEEIQKLKGTSEKNIAVFGSSNLCVSLLEMGFLDEVRLMVAPVILGEGTPLFSGIKEKVEMKQTGKRNFKNGNILMTYEVVKHV